MDQIYSFNPLKKTRLYEKAAEQIKKSIFNGYLKPGELLPSERSLAEMFGVGRPTIREALRSLDVLGLIEMNQTGKGYIVCSPDVAEYLETLGEQMISLIHPNEKTLRDLWEVRNYIELGVAHTVALNATQDDFDELDRTIKKMESALYDFEEYFPLGADFHKKLALISGNKFFYIIWAMLQNILLKGYNPILEDLFPEGPQKLLYANKQLLDAIRSKDPKKINKAMKIHSEIEDVFNHNKKEEEE